MPGLSSNGSSSTTGQSTTDEQLIIDALTPLLEKIIKDVPNTTQLDQMTDALRILAILLGPAPENHKLVWKECWQPLAKDILRSIFDQVIEDDMEQESNMRSLINKLDKVRDEKLMEYKEDLQTLARVWLEIQSYTVSAANSPSLDA